MKKQKKKFQQEKDQSSSEENEEYINMQNDPIYKEILERNKRDLKQDQKIKQQQQTLSKAEIVIDFKRKEVEQNEERYQAQKQELVGPVKPSEKFLEEINSDSSQEDDVDKQNQKIFEAQKQQNLSPQALQRQQKMIEYKLQKQNQSDSSSDHDVLQNDPVYLQSKKQQNLEIQSDKVSQNQQNDDNNDQEQEENQIKQKIIYDREHQKQQQFERSRSRSQEEEEDAENNNEQKLLRMGIPCSLETYLKGHSKLVSTFALDNNAIRLATGSYDYNIKLWDFQGMNRNMSSFRQIEPIEGQPLKRISYSKDGKQILVVVGGKQIKLLDKDGKQGKLSVKGDMYLTDMSKTKGHVADLNDGYFSPSEINWFATCSNDSTIRFWDINQRLHGIEQQMAHTYLIKCSDQKGQKAPVNTLQYSNDGKSVFVGCQDGSIQGFSTKSSFHRPSHVVRGAHLIGQEIVAVQLFSDNQRIVSRSLDNTVKIWDLRNFKNPLESLYNMHTTQPGSRVCISPNQKYILVPTYYARDKQSLLHFYDADKFQYLGKLSLGDENITDIQWNARLNQIFIAQGDNVRVFFDSNLSQKGALLCASKQPRQMQLEDTWQGERKIFVPNALQMFHDKKQQKLLEKERIKNVDISKYGPGKQGNIKGSSTVTQFLMRVHNELPDTREDPQAALLKFAEEAKNNPQFLHNAYKDNQPVPIYNETPQEVEEQVYLATIKKICPHCGLKLCTCDKRTEFEDRKFFDTYEFGEDVKK